MITRREFAVTSAAAIATACTSKAGQRRLNVMNWGDYIAPNTIASFEREFNVRVRYSTYENNEELFAKVMSGNSGWDVVFPTHNRIAPLRELGLIQPLDHARLANASNLFARFQRPNWDPNLDWNIPYMWTTTGIAYNRVKYAPAPESWSDLWRAEAKGKLTMLDDIDDVFGAALAKLGYSYNAPDAAALRRAQSELIAQKPLVRAYLSTEAKDQMVAGDVLIAETFATTAQLAIDGNKDLAFIFPREPFAAYCDCGVILKESKRAELAHDFLNYILRPEISAEIAHTIRTGTPNEKAFQILDKEGKTTPALYPDDATLHRAEWPSPLPPAIVRLRDRLWTEAKAA